MRIKLRFKVLGLSVLALSVMAIGTTGAARAETGACWGYLEGANLKCFSAGGLEAKPVFAVESLTGTLLIAGQNVEILCTGMEFDEGGRLTSNGSVTLGRVKFTGCGTLIGKVISKPCLPKDPVAGPDAILTEKINGLIQLHGLTSGELEPTVVFKPDTGEILAVIHLGEECAFGEEIVVKGKFVAWDCVGKKSFETHQLTHLFSEFPSLKLMKVGANLATIDGSANVTLGSPHATLKWAGKAA